MRKSSFSGILSLLSIFLMASIGCKSSSPVAPVEIVPVTVSNDVIPPSGGFIFKVNGISLEHFAADKFSEADARVSPNNGFTAPAGSKDMVLILSTTQLYRGKNQYVDIDIFLSGIQPVPGTYPLVKRKSGYNLNYVTVLAEGIQLESLDSGMVEITKFDTILNLISGKFKFNAYATYPVVDPSKIDTITAGYFTDIPIAYGSFGQGSITANIDGYSYNQIVDNYNTAAGIIDRENGLLTLQSQSSDGIVGYQLDLSLYKFTVGEYNIGGQGFGNIGDANYYETTSNSTRAIQARTGATGKITITKCDMAARRISGTFYLSGKDSSGKTINITNGVIDNVQWSMP